MENLEIGKKAFEKALGNLNICGWTEVKEPNEGTDQQPERWERKQERDGDVVQW